MRQASPLLITTVLALAGASAHAGGLAFDSQPASNSVAFANHLAGLGAGAITTLDFETHPLGALQPGHYAAQGVTMTLVGGNLSFNEVYDYRNNYSGTVFGFGPNSSAEGPASESRAYSAFSPDQPWQLVLDFAQPVLGAGLYVIDLFNGLGNRRTTLAAYDGAGGSGQLLAMATAPDYNYQLYNKLFLGVATDNAVAVIRSVVFTNPLPVAGDGIALDDIRIAAAVPEPGTWGLLAAGLGVVALRSRKRRD
jgi:PEP-CTERM motif